MVNSINTTPIEVAQRWSGPPSQPSSNRASEYANDLSALRASIAAARGDPRNEEGQLAIDVLVNLAARTDEIGTRAQEELRDIYAKPASGDPSTDKLTRNQLLNAAHSVCMLALDLDLSERQTTAVPLSATVAKLALHAPESPEGVNGGGPKSLLTGYLAGKLAVLGPSERDDVVANNRMVSDRELIAAGKGLKSLEVWDAPIETSQAMRDSTNEQFAAVAKQAIDTKRPVAVWVQTGDDKFKHWMPVVATPTKDGVHWHILNTESTTPGALRTSRALGTFLADAGYRGRIRLHHADMQQNAPNACGVLGHRMLKDLDKRLAERPNSEQGLNDFVNDAIEDHTTAWAKLTAEDQQAAALAGRAELFEATLNNQGDLVANRPAFNRQKLSEAQLRQLDAELEKRKVTEDRRKNAPGSDGNAVRKGAAERNKASNIAAGPSATELLKAATKADEALLRDLKTRQLQPLDPSATEHVTAGKKRVVDHLEKHGLQPLGPSAGELVNAEMKVDKAVVDQFKRKQSLLPDLDLKAMVEEAMLKRGM